MWPNFFAFATLAVVSFWDGRSTISKGYPRFLVSTVIAMAIMGGAEIVGVGFQIPTLLKLYPLRISMLFPLVCAPMIVKWAFDAMTTNDSLLRWAPAAMVVLVAAYSYGIFLPVWLALLAYVAVQQRTAQLLVNGVVLAIVSVLVIRPDLREYIVPTLYLPSGLKMRVVIPGVILGLLLLTYKYGGSELRRFLGNRLVIAAGILLFGLGLAKARHAYLQLMAGSQQAVYSAQVWARTNSPKDAVFITQSSWRGYSERQAVVPAIAGSWIYSGDEKVKELDDRLIRFWGLEERAHLLGAAQVAEQVRDSFGTMKTEDVLRFAKHFGGTYVVRSDGMVKLNLPIAFKMDGISIYRIPSS